MGTFLVWVLLVGGAGNPGGCQDPHEEACAYGGEKFIKQFVPMCMKRSPDIKAPRLEHSNKMVALFRRTVFCDCLVRKAAKYIEPKDFVKSLVEDHEDRPIELHVYTNVKNICVDYTLLVTSDQEIKD